MIETMEKPSLHRAMKDLEANLTRCYSSREEINNLRKIVRSTSHNIDSQLSSFSNPYTKLEICYRECQRNIAASIGGCVVDGCGEFVPIEERSTANGEERTSNLKCAACGCHRSFHRREERIVKSTRNPPTTFSNENEPGKVARSSGSSSQRKASQHGFIDVNACFENFNSIASALQALERNSLIMRETVHSLAKIQKEVLEIDPMSDSDVTKKNKKNLEWGEVLSEDLSNSGGNGLYSSDSLTMSDMIEPWNMQQESFQNTLIPAFGLPNDEEHGGDFIHNFDFDSLFNNYSNSYALTDIAKKKRKRSKFSEEQKEKLVAFAQKVGWTIVGQKKEDLDAMCKETGISLKSLKYWIHNSKQKSNKKS